MPKAMRAKSLGSSLSGIVFRIWSKAFLLNSTRLFSCGGIISWVRHHLGGMLVIYRLEN